MPSAKFDGKYLHQSTTIPQSDPVIVQGVDPRLINEILDFPGMYMIERHMFNAQDLGLDIRDPEVLRRCINAGKLEWNDYQQQLREDNARWEAYRHEPIVYYVRLADLVKIGTTQRIDNRMSAVSPQQIMGIERGSYFEEAKRHRDFKHLNTHGEWFRIEPDLETHINGLRSSFEKSAGATVGEWLKKHLSDPQYRKMVAPWLANSRLSG